MNDNDSPEQESSGTTRRRFLGAAAAAAGLAGFTGTSAATESPTPNSVIENQYGADDGPYTVTECGAVPGELGTVQVGTDMADGPVEVTGVYEPDGWSGVSLSFTTDAVDVSTGLNADDARELADRLIIAAEAAEGQHGD